MARQQAVTRARPLRTAARWSWRGPWAAGWLLACLFLVGAAPMPTARAEEAWEREVREARRQQDLEIARVRRQGAKLDRVITSAKSKLGRSNTPLNTYLVGRALYHNGKADDAAEYMQRALALDPSFWFAHLSLAQLALEREDAKTAEQHLRVVFRRRPDDTDALKMAVGIHVLRQDWRAAVRVLDVLLQRITDVPELHLTAAQCRMRLKEWDRAIGHLNVLLRESPSSPQLRLTIAEIRMEQKEWDIAIRELEAFMEVLPRDARRAGYLLRAQGMIGVAHYNAGRMDEAATAMEAVLQQDPKALQALDLLEVVYGRAKRWTDLARILQAKLPLVKGTPKEEDRVRKLLAAIESGEVAEAERPQWPEDSLGKLIDECLDMADVEGRRRALHKYYEMKVAFVPVVIYARMDPQMEPDPECRLLIARILGSLQTRRALKHIARGLRDEDARVRTVAAEEMGMYPSRGVIVYLLAYFLGPRFEDVPQGAQARLSFEREFNAARIALGRQTEHRAIPLAAANWVGADEALAVREAWRRYFDGAEGRRQKAEAIRNFVEFEEPYPERYLIKRMFDKDAPLVVIEAYKVLRLRAQAAVNSQTEAVRETWKTFPIVADEEVTPETADALRERVRTWLKSRTTGAGGS